MEWEETDTLVHFYIDQDKTLYMKLPGTSLWKVREERQESLLKALKEIGYKPIPITRKKEETNEETTQNTTENITRLLQEGGPRRLPLPSGATITIYTENNELKATLIEEGISTELRGPQEILEIIIHHTTTPRVTPMTKMKPKLTPPTPKLPLTDPNTITPEQRERIAIELYREGYIELEISNILLTNSTTVSETIRNLAPEEKQKPRVRIDGKIIAPRGGCGPRPTIFEILLLDLFSRFFTRSHASRILEITPSVGINNIRTLKAGEYDEIFTRYKETHGEDPREIFAKICMETTGKPPEQITLQDIHQHGGKLVENTRKEIQRRRKKLIKQKPGAIIQNTMTQPIQHTRPWRRSYR